MAEEFNSKLSVASKASQYKGRYTLKENTGLLFAKLTQRLITKYEPPYKKTNNVHMYLKRKTPLFLLHG